MKQPFSPSTPPFSITRRPQDLTISLQESTLRLSDTTEFGERPLTRLSDRMWNLGTALYYKSGGKPWKLNTAREGVCYIGIAFRRASDSPKTACCAAQMFLDSGDGIVFLGEYGPWYSPENNQFHLSRAAAKKLLEGVLKTYADLDGQPLKEVFLHCRSSISKDEFAGYQEACPSGCKIVGIRVRSDGYGPRLFRDGSMPVVRGTFLKTSERSGLLYAAGFKPRLGTYDGWETPVPLRIDIQHGEAPIELVATDILGLRTGRKITSVIVAAWPHDTLNGGLLVKQEGQGNERLCGNSGAAHGAAL